jgi:flagellar L-ring protein precursor FlgH
MKKIAFLLTLLLVSSAACIKNPDTQNSQIGANQYKSGSKKLALERDLSIEDYLKSQQGKYSILSDGAAAESLWDETYGNGFLFVDHKARKIGDIITVQIIESSSASKNATTKTSRDSSIEAGVDNILGTPSHLGMKNFLNMKQPFSPNAKGSFKGSFNGSGATSRSGKITATISAEVVEVFPNGNLKIFGHREIKVNEENQIITLVGIVRPQDVDESNSVRSTSIAEAQIKYYGNGVIANKQKEGWLARFFNFVWPF